MMDSSVPIPTAHLFPVLDTKLLGLLGALREEEWYRPTIAKKWLVKDIAAHLLDGNFRTLSLSRDKLKLQPPEAITSYQGLVDYLNELNAVWVKAFRRVSPGLLLELLELTGKQYCEYMLTLDPFAEAIFPVAWAGEEVSRNWFHIAREYTEKFIHQLQIREAVHQPGLFNRELFYPFIDTLLQGLPHCFRHIEASAGTTIQVTISSDAGGDWFLNREENSWRVKKDRIGQVASLVTIDPDTAWRLFSKGMTPGEARGRVDITGDDKLGAQVLQMVAVMA